MSALRGSPLPTVIPSIRFAGIRPGVAWGCFCWPAELEEGIEARLARASRCKKARVRFVNTPRHAVKIHLWPTLGALNCRKLLKSDACLLQNRQSGAFVRIVCARHSQCAAPKEQLHIPALLILLPVPQRACDHVYVQDGRGAIRGSYRASLTA